MRFRVKWDGASGQYIRLDDIGAKRSVGAPFGLGNAVGRAGLGSNAGMKLLVRDPPVSVREDRGA
jgi:hypothetical protein